MIKLIFNINNLPEGGEINFLDKARTAYLGKVAGSEKIYVNIDKVEPGFKSTKYHSHSKQEEFFLILKGTGTIRINNEEHNILEGDFISKVAGKGIAHQFINNGTETLEILDVGTKEQGDVVHYPDEDVYYLSDEELVFHKQDHQNGWTSEPNE